MSYDEKFKLLKQMTENLQNDNLPLEEAMEIYAEANKLYLECVEYLENAKGKVFKIKKDTETYKEERID